MPAKDEAVAEFAVRFKDEVSGGVKSAAHALEDLRKRIKDEESSLASMQKAMKRLQASTVVDVDAFRKLRTAMEDTRKSLAANQASFVGLGGDVTKMGQSLIDPTARTRSFKDRFRELQEASGQVPGPLGRITSSLSKMIDGVSMAQLKLVALIAGFAAATIAAAAFAVSLAKTAIIAGDARRNELLHLEALTKMRNMWGLAAGSSTQMQAAIDRVSAGVSIAREKVAGFGEQLYRSGLRGDALTTALEGASIKASALGDAAGSAFAGFAATVNMTGGSVKRLTEDVRNRFGGVVSAQMKSLEVSALKQKEAYDSLFAGLHIEKALDSFARLRTLFAQNTEAGRVMKQLLTLMLQPLINAAESAATFFRRFFKQMLIGVGEIVLAYVIVRDKFREAFGSSKQKKDMDSLLDKLQLGRYATYLLAAAFVTLGARITIAALTALVNLTVGLSRYVIVALTRAIPATIAFTRELIAQAAVMEGRLIPIMTKQLTFSLRAAGAGFLSMARNAGVAAVTALRELCIRLYVTTGAMNAQLLPALMRGVVALRGWAVAAWEAVAPLLYIGGIIALAAVALWGLYKIGELVYTFFHEIDWSKGIGDGLLLGIKALGFAVVEAFKQLGMMAVNAFKTVLGIASPSKVFAELGMRMPEGVAQGVEQGSPKAQQAVDAMITPRVNAGDITPLAARAQSGGGAKISIGEMHIHASGNQPDDFAEAVRRKVESMLEELAAELGARPAGAT